ncbi:MAG: 50S ribosomal protein L35 [SAR324 cluster bacterium]|nr:50S ribosomal protein L35 [SAR324 cluster bacterium]
MGNKLKTNKSAAKRFRVSSNGLIKFKRAKMRHRQRSKSKDVKRELRKPGYLSGANAKSAHIMLPYL